MDGIKARQALENDEVPVGCLVVDRDNNILITAHNDVNRTKNPNRHAEIVALQRLYEMYGDGVKDIVADCTMYVTSEPCIMCCTAWRAIGIKHIVFGAPNPRFGGCGSIIDVARISPFTASMDTLYPSYADVIENIRGNVCEDEAIALLKEFYARGNPRTVELKPRKRKC